MEKGINRRDFMKKGLAAGAGFVVSPMIIYGLAGICPEGNVKKRKFSYVHLEHITNLWKVPGSNKIGVEGWNKDGLWRFCYNWAESESESEVGDGLFFDYRHIIFKRYDDRKRTLAQLRENGVPWEEINRLHSEGFSWNPGYRLVSSEELPV